MHFPRRTHSPGPCESMHLSWPGVFITMQFYCRPDPDAKSMHCYCCILALVHDLSIFITTWCGVSKLMWFPPPPVPRAHSKTLPARSKNNENSNPRRMDPRQHWNGPCCQSTAGAQHQENTSAHAELIIATTLTQNLQFWQQTKEMLAPERFSQTKKGFRTPRYPKPWSPGWSPGCSTALQALIAFVFLKIGRACPTYFLKKPGIHGDWANTHGQTNTKPILGARMES